MGGPTRHSPAPPPVEGHAWGRIVVAGETWRDAKLGPGGGRAWDWRETGTSHDDGILPADVEELLDHGVRHVLLSLGRQRRLRVHADTVALLGAHGIAHEQLETGAAIARYGQLRLRGTAVGALVHTTC